MAEGPTPRRRTAVAMQQELASDNGTNAAVIWDLYSSNDKDVLKAKIMQLMPNNKIDLDSIMEDPNLTTAEKHQQASKMTKEMERNNSKLDEARVRLLNSIWAQRKYCNRNLLMSILFVIHTVQDDSVPISYAKYKTEFSLHPLFRVRKCKRGNSVDNCCMVFVDENGRVYKNWEDYVEENTLPEGVIVAPTKGIYDFDEEDNVKLELHKTPESTVLKKTLGYIDKGTSFIGLGAAAVPVAALAFPVAAPVLAISGVAALGTGVWSVIRSSVNLADRGNHEESISLSDRQARASWFGVAGGAIGLGASGASQALVRYAAAGKEISTATQLAVNGMNMASLTINGVSVGNGVYDLILKYQDEEISTLDVLQLSASLILFTHSLYNFQYASTIVESTKNGTITDFRKNLSNRQRKMFDKMVRETIRIKGPNQGKTEVIRAIGKIPDNQMFNDLYKIRKNFGENVKPSFAGDGNVLLNDDVTVSSGVLRQNLQHNIGENILNNVGPLPASHPVIPENTPQNLNTIFKAVTPRFIDITVRFVLANCHVLNESDLRNCLRKMSDRLIESAVTEIITIARKFVEDFFSELQSRIEQFVSFERILFETFNVACDIAGPRRYITPSWLNEVRQEIIDILKAWARNLIEPDLNAETCELCKICGGSFSIVSLTTG